MGLQSLMLDLGIELVIRVMTDASAAKAIAGRKGLGKVRHIATHYLWLQEKVARGNVEVIKIKGEFNSADLFTKHLDRAKMEEAISQFGHTFEEGRSDSAPSLDLMTYDGTLLPLYMLSVGIKADYV